MKTKKILTILLAFLLAFTFTLPALAGAEELPPAPVEEEETVQPPEELPPEAPEAPEETLPPEEVPPAEEVPPVEPPVEDPEPDGTPAPDPLPEEPPDALPEEPEAPEEPETPDISEDPDLEAPDGPADDAPPPEEEELPAEEEFPEEEPVQEPEEPVIDVLVPQSGHVIINPYHMEVDLPDGGVSRDQIINPMQTLVNFSTVPVQVDAWVVGQLPPESMARFVDFPPSPDAEEKEIFMYAEFQTDPAMWSGWYGDMDDQILVTGFGAFKENVMTLELGAEGYFRLFGAMTGDPDEMWESADAPDVTVTFSFTPIAAEEEPPAEENVPEDVLEDMPEDVPEDMPEDAPEDILEDAPEDIPEDIPETAPEVLPPDEEVPPVDDAVLPPETEVVDGQLEEPLVDHS